MGEIGVDATILLEAWRFGDDLGQKPRYAISVSGTDGHTMDNAIFIASRGQGEVDWWSVYRLGTGQHLFDTDVPLVSFSISKQFLTTRYVGLDVPSNDVSDSRLKQPNVVAVLTYASAERDTAGSPADLRRRRPGGAATFFFRYHPVRFDG